MNALSLDRSQVRVAQALALHAAACRTLAASGLRGCSRLREPCDDCGGDLRLCGCFMLYDPNRQVSK